MNREKSLNKKLVFRLPNTHGKTTVRGWGMIFHRASFDLPNVPVGLSRNLDLERMLALASVLPPKN